jgi:hypothetical protein
MSHCDWRSVSQLVLVSSTIWGSWPDIYNCLTITVLFFMRRPFWGEDGSVICTCCWSLPVQSFSGPSPLRLAAIFYCLRFKTSFFVASYDSQGHGGGIRPLLNLFKVKVKVTLRLTVSQSVSLGVEPHLGLMTRYWVLFDSYGLVFFCGVPSLTRGRVCLLSESLSALVSHLL